MGADLPPPLLPSASSPPPPGRSSSPIAAMHSAISVPGAVLSTEPLESSTAPGVIAAVQMDAPPGGSQTSSGPRHCAVVTL